MINLKEDIEVMAQEYMREIKEKSILLKFLAMRLLIRLGPETYEATTIHDFLENEGSIRPTYGIFPAKLFFLGQAIVYIDNPITRLSHFSL